MSAPKPHLVQVVIKAPSNVNDLIAHAKNVVAALKGNPYVPSPNPSLATRQRPSTSSEDRRLAWRLPDWGT